METNNLSMRAASKMSLTQTSVHSHPNGQQNSARRGQVESGHALAFSLDITEENSQDRRNFLTTHTGMNYPQLFGEQALPGAAHYNGNIENFVGMAQIPVGVVGPLRIKGSAGEIEAYLPLATSEGALVASYHRGIRACYAASGAHSICIAEGVQRSPLFKFSSLSALLSFLNYCLPLLESWKSLVSKTSQHAQLLSLKPHIEGNHLFLTFEYYCADAAGQNMVSICTQALCEEMLAKSPVQPERWFIEGNFAGDKKACMQSLLHVRGKKVVAEIELPRNVVSEVLKSTPEDMHAYWEASTMGVLQSGAIGAQGHYANGLTALFLATGQDVACVSEAAVGITRMELTDAGDLYASVTLPNLIVGTVGGGTHLPTQRESLEMMGCYGKGKAVRFAELTAALLLAGELSIAAALAAGHFTAAHQKFGRKKPK